MLQLNAKILLLHLLLFLVLIIGSLSNAFFRQAKGNSAASNGKAMSEDLHLQTATKRFGLGGRKMGFDSLMTLEKLKGHEPCERPSKKPSSSKRKQSIRTLRSKENEAAGFVAFNADYN